MTGGFDEYLDDLRGQMARCAAEAAAEHARSRPTDTGAARTDARSPALSTARRSKHWPEPRRALAWAAVLCIGVAALVAGLLMVDDRPQTPASTSGLAATPGGRHLPAYVQPVVPIVSASPSPRADQGAAGPGYSLAAIDEVTPADVWSVGARGDSGVSAALAGMESHSFVVHFDGTTWREAGVPDVGPLTAVAASGQDDVWALGPSGAILHWDGEQWATAVSALQDGDAVLHGLAALGPDDVWAVGSVRGAPYAVNWNGATWRVVALPAAPGGGSLNAISGTATDLWVVGAAADDAHVLAMHFDGATWSIVPDAGVSDGGLLTVAAIGPDDVWAGGDALLQHFDGTQWRDVSQTFSGVHQGLAAFSSSDVWLGAAGGVASFDGANWQSVTARDMGLPGASVQFAAVSALAPTDVWAAGSVGRGSASVPLVVHYNGVAWRPAVDSVQSR